MVSNPPVTIKTALLPDPPRVAGILTGIPDDLADDLAELLAWVRRHRDAGRPVAEVRADALFLARGAGRLPLYSLGGVADSISAVLGEPPWPSPSRRHLPTYLRPRCPHSGWLLWRTATGRVALCVVHLCHRCGRPVPTATSGTGRSQGGGA